MRSRVSGCLPPACLFASAARVCVIGLTVVASGCASKEGPRYAGAALPQQVSERQWKVEIEEDGKPAQAPPVRRMRPEEDDPSQPWSPNYGRSRSGPSGPVPVAPTPQQTAPRTPWPKPVETSVRRAIADTEADALVARAVNAHEMRQP